MRTALDKLRSVLVALTCDQHSSAALLRDALSDLEREDAARRAFGDALRDRSDKTRAARHVPVLTPADAVAKSIRGTGAADALMSVLRPDRKRADAGSCVLADDGRVLRIEGCDCGGPDQCHNGWHGGICRIDERAPFGSADLPPDDVAGQRRARGAA